MSLLLLYSVSERTQCRPLRFLGRHYLHYQLSPLRSLLLKLVIAAYGDYRLRAAQYLLWKLGGTLMLSFVSPVLTLKVLFPFLVLFLGTNPTPIFIVIDCYPLWTTIHNIYSSFVSEFCELSVYKFLGCYLHPWQETLCRAKVNINTHNCTNWLRHRLHRVQAAKKVA